MVGFSPRTWPRGGSRPLLLLGACTLSACAVLRGGGDVPRWELNGRPARDLPTLFLSDSTAAETRSERPTAACAARLRDPRDGTRLVLERSQAVGTNTAAATGTDPHVPVSAPATARDRTPRPIPSPPRELRGDYRVETSGRYGVSADERLRIDCLSGRVIGIVGAPADG